MATPRRAHVTVHGQILYVNGKAFVRPDAEGDRSTETVKDTIVNDKSPRKFSLEPEP